jgi:hypothetical protein
MSDNQSNRGEQVRARMEPLAVELFDRWVRGLQLNILRLLADHGEILTRERWLDRASYEALHRLRTAGVIDRKCVGMDYRDWPYLSDFSPVHSWRICDRRAAKKLYRKLSKQFESENRG